MLNQSLKPIFVGSIIHNSHGKIKIAMPNGDVIKVQTDPVFFRELIQLCNGMQTIKEILECLSKKWDQKSIIVSLNAFFDAHIMVDSRSMANHVWEIVKNPTHFFHHLTEQQIGELVIKAHKHHLPNEENDSITQGRAEITQGLCFMDRRISWRTFRDEPIRFQQLTNILWACYGKTSNNLRTESGFVSRHTIPSAGALFPLSVSVVLFTDISPISKGIYWISFGDNSKVFYQKISDDILGILQSLADPLSVENASALLVISGDFHISEEKYANRALLYIPLEAGHAAQNVLLAATQENIAAVELGGFMENPMQRILEQNTHIPLTTIALGNPSDNPDKDYLLPSTIEIEWAPAFAGNYRLPFCMVFLKSRNYVEESDWCNGRSKNPALALAKAHSEFIERDGCNCIPKLFLSPYRDIADHALDPRQHIAYHHEQYASRWFPYAPFNVKTAYLWHQGEQLANGVKTHLLADSIFFPFTPEYPPYTSANSSGAATHPSKEQAIKNALFEIIERDAFMVVWLNRISPQFFRLYSLPCAVQQRVRALKKSDFNVLILDATTDTIPVIICVAKSAKLQMTTVSASANFVIEEAVDHALTEIEGSVYCALSHGVEHQHVQIRQVKHTDDHGNVYLAPRYYERADFLMHGNPATFREPSGGNMDTAYLISLLTSGGHHIFVADLHPKTKIAHQHASVKVFVTGFVPMTFGYREEPCGMPRVYKLPVQMGWREKETLYAHLNRFPHPFT